MEQKEEKSKKELKEEEKEVSKKEDGAGKKKLEEIKAQLQEKFENLSKELELKKKEAEEYKELAQRIKAEFDNYRKRVLKEGEERIILANENLITKLLPILDSFELAINFTNQINEKQFESFYNGVKIIYNNLKNLLAEFGLKEIEIKDSKFDPNYQEVVIAEEDENVEEVVVKEVLSKGYILGNKILRSAKVKVLKPKEKVKSDLKDSEKVNLETVGEVKEEDKN